MTTTQQTVTSGAQSCRQRVQTEDSDEMYVCMYLFASGNMAHITEKLRNDIDRIGQCKK